VFILNLCHAGDDIICIDHFDLMCTTAGREQCVNVMHRDEFRMTLLEEDLSAITPGFDWIYIDRSHEADHTFLDGDLAWRLARTGSIPDGEYEHLFSQSQHQMILRMASDMRIGFLVKQRPEQWRMY
jgi:hypothetical protein